MGHGKEGIFIFLFFTSSLPYSYSRATESYIRAKEQLYRGEGVGVGGGGWGGGVKEHEKTIVNS